MAASAATITSALFFLVCVSGFSSASAKGGFTIDLIHRDSPLSPFYNSSETASQRLKNAFRRSFGRVNHFKTKVGLLSSSADRVQPNLQAEATLIYSHFEYIIELSIGTPPFPIRAIADTGSDLIWTQCEPCVNCYKQTDPLFNPESSSTYRTIDPACKKDLCDPLGGITCTPHSNDVCQYEMTYADETRTRGDYATDTVTLASSTGRSVSFPTTIIGCGHNNTNHPGEEAQSGVVGLGRGPQSLISQLGTSIDGKFSYCMVDPSSSTAEKNSKLSFGENAIVSGEGVMSTPIVKRQNEPTTYYLTLEAISVDDTKITFDSSSSTSDGNIVIDSGTTLTFLKEEFYRKVEYAVDQAIQREGMQSEEQRCYKVGESEELTLPKITVHFSGADVELEDINAFSRNEDAICFNFAPDQKMMIYGNSAQSNFLIGYDLQGSTVSFKKTDCTNL